MCARPERGTVLTDETIVLKVRLFDRSNQVKGAGQQKEGERRQAGKYSIITRTEKRRQEKGGEQKVSNPVSPTNHRNRRQQCAWRSTSAASTHKCTNDYKTTRSRPPTSITSNTKKKEQREKYLNDCIILPFKPYPATVNVGVVAPGKGRSPPPPLFGLGSMIFSVVAPGKGAFPNNKKRSPPRGYTTPTFTVFTQPLLYMYRRDIVLCTRKLRGR